MILLGVDVGGSKTHAVLADEHGRVLGVGLAGGGNWEGVGLDRARAAWAAAIAAALEQAGVTSAEISAGAFGLAGLDWPSDEARLRPVVESLALGGPFTMVNDAFLPLRAGTDDGVGLGAIAGSGCTVAGRNRSGDMARSFGAAYPFTDWGGGHDIAREAVHVVAAAYIGLGPETALTERLVAATGVRDVAELLEGVMRWKIKIKAPFAPEVFAAAHAGDDAAIAIIRRAGTTIGRNALAVARRLDMLGEPFTLVTAGGVFSSHSPILMESLLETLHTQAPQIKLVHWTAPPVIGAVLLAADLRACRPDRDRLTEEACDRLAACPVSPSLHRPIHRRGREG